MTDVTGSGPGFPDFERTACAAQRGDADALDRLMAVLQPILQAFVHQQTRGELWYKESRADLLQSICREVVDDLGGWQDRGPGSFRAWLITVARNRLNQKRKFWAAERRDPRRERRLDSVAPSRGPVGSQLAREVSPSQDAAVNEQEQRIRAAAQQLPPALREVFFLRRFEDLSHAQIAERLGKSEGAVRVALHRASIAVLAAYEGRDDNQSSPRSSLPPRRLPARIP